MSTDYKVPYTEIKAIKPHPGADRLEVAICYEWEIIVQKDKYKVGDKVILVPIDSILPEWLNDRIFPPTAKVKLNKRRVRQIKLRGYPSQGMLLDVKDVEDKLNFSFVTLETNLSEVLGIEKYEPPTRGVSMNIRKDKHRNKIEDHPQFHCYNGIANLKWGSPFLDSEPVVVQEKLHGTNCRAGLLPYIANTWVKKLKKFFNLAPEYERVYGSNRVEISARSDYKGFYGEDIYGIALAESRAFQKIKPGEIIYGEVIGPNIQANYTYGLSEHHFVLFDVKIVQLDGSLQWLNPDQVAKYATERGFDFVPVLYIGPYNKAYIEMLITGHSVYCTKQKVKEGVVIKSRYGYNDETGSKRAVKWINPDYLSDSTNTDDH